MGSAKNVILSSLLGAVSGGANKYLDENKNQREYALKRLEILKPPSEIESLKYVEPGFDNLSEEDRRKRLLQYKSAGAGLDVDVTSSGDVSKRTLNPRAATRNEDFKAASRREQLRKQSGRSSDPTDAAIVEAGPAGTSSKNSNPFK